ncbi:Pentatricopeptide repeat-containing protein [Hibiscus syriacus]|uniref:Pentatricopeptide repeat-containing protein n=1 Tax=Hibiscus syriacus TaxID=106335 RepID=A0A6A2Z6E2_HIBSY|nr:Pentatricopeptide repeat-containing protein [Hibiscus syriacus]
MASLKLPLSLDSIDSKKLNFHVNPSHLPDQCSGFSFTSCFHVTRAASILGSLTRFKHIRVSRFGTEPNPVDRDTLFSSRNELGNENPEFVKGKEGRNHQKGVKRNVGFKFGFRRINNGAERGDFLVFRNGGLDVDYSAITHDLKLGDCNSILKRLEKSDDGNALRFFEWMKSNGKLEGNVTAYRLVLRVLGRREDWDAAESMVREANGDSSCELNSQVFNTIIYACSRRGLVEMGAKWFRMMLEYGVQPNVATYGMLMGLYQKSWNVREAEFAFSQMRNSGILCQSAYSAMITIYTRLSLYGKAEEIIGFMREDKVALNLENWLVMLNAYSQSGKLEEAEQVLALMQEAGFCPNIVAYNTLITGYGKASNMDAAQRVFLSIRQVGLHPDETTYRSMIEGWGRTGNYKQVGWYYKELKQLGFKPNSSNLYTLLTLQAKCGDEEGAIRTLDDMLKMRCQHASVLGTVLQAYEKAGRIDKVPLVLTGSFRQHVLDDPTSCSILVMAYVKSGLVTDAIEVLRRKKWKDSSFEDNLYHLLICSCKESGDLDNAVKIFYQMPNSEKKTELAYKYVQ